MKLYDFGADFRGRKPEALKAIAWPVNVWACYIPENVNPQLNILEKLILSLINKGVVKTRKELTDILVKQVKLNEDLVKNVLDECTQKHFNQSHKIELKLKVDAEKLLSAIDDDISPEMPMSDTTKKIYLFQDAVTNTVVPCFSIENLPTDNDYEFLEDENCVFLQPLYSTQPKTAAINNALRQWGRIFKAINSGETVEENQIHTETEPTDLDDEDELIMDEPAVTTLADKEGKLKSIDVITVFDDEPRTYLAKGYLAFNPSNPTEIEIISPFGKVFDHWFMKLVDRLRVFNEQFAEDLQIFLIERTELFKGTIAFGNDLDIQLFNDFPVICNDNKYADLKKAIKDLSKDVDRIRKGEDESTNFAKNLRTAIEVMFRTVIKVNPDIAKIKTEYKNDNDFYKYKYEILQVVETNRLDDEIKQKFINIGVFRNVYKQYSNNPKDNAALILLYANKHPASLVMEFIKNYDYIFIDLFKMVSLGTDAGHAGKNFTTMYFSEDEVEQYYSKYENMVRALYSCLVEGAK